MPYECPKKTCSGDLEYVNSFRRGDKYRCAECGKEAWYEGSSGFDIPGLP